MSKNPGKKRREKLRKERRAVEKVIARLTAQEIVITYTQWKWVQGKGYLNVR